MTFSTLLGHVQHISTVYLSKKMVNTAQNVRCTIVLPEALPVGQILVQAIINNFIMLKKNANKYRKSFKEKQLGLGMAKKRIETSW